jgi:RimJ/RimL family protein N-acetyltransferase
VTYWIDRSYWGRGIAGRALAQLLDLVPVRPLWARAASDNAGSLRVLRRAGFEITGTSRDYAPGRGEEIEETILRLKPRPGWFAAPVRAVVEVVYDTY